MDLAPTPTAVPSRRLPSSRAPDRRMAILLAAEKLFALHGFHAVSIRDIAAEAGVPLALVGYYFGAKADLYHAIFESWMGTVEQRVTGLRNVMTQPDSPDRLERLLDAFVSPVIAMSASPEGQYWALMAARDLAASSPEADRVHREFYDPMANEFIDALNAVFPIATRGQVAWCYQFALGAMVHFLTDRRVERLSKGENRPADPQAKGDLLRFITAGFRAVLPAGRAKTTPKNRSRRQA
jgi:AcrR family transcriptional regulator